MDRICLEDFQTSVGFIHLQQLPTAPLSHLLLQATSINTYQLSLHAYRTCRCRNGLANSMSHRVLSWRHPFAFLAFSLVSVVTPAAVMDTQQVSDHITTRKALRINGSPQHGEVLDFHGERFRWHQIALGMWRGISSEQWDHAIHVRNDTPIAFHDTLRVESSGENDTTPLIPREEDPGSCLAIKSCGVIVRDSLLPYLKNFGHFIRHLIERFGPNIWLFLNQPIIVALTVGVGAAALSGYVAAWTGARNSASRCSKVATDADAIQSAMSSIVAENPYRAISIDFGVDQAGNVAGTMHMEVVSSNGKGDETCGPPPRNMLTIEEPPREGKNVSTQQDLDSSTTAITPLAPPRKPPSQKRDLAITFEIIVAVVSHVAAIATFFNTAYHVLSGLDWPGHEIRNLRITRGLYAFECWVESGFMAPRFVRDLASELLAMSERVVLTGFVGWAVVRQSPGTVHRFALRMVPERGELPT